MRINTIINCGLLLLKTAGMVLFFLLSKALLQFILGSKTLLKKTNILAKTSNNDRLLLMSYAAFFLPSW
jgi:hypothetical protein